MPQEEQVIVIHKDQGLKFVWGAGAGGNDFTTSLIGVAELVGGGGGGNRGTGGGRERAWRSCNTRLMTVLAASEGAGEYTADPERLHLAAHDGAELYFLGHGANGEHCLNGMKVAVFVANFTCAEADAVGGIPDDHGPVGNNNAQADTRGGSPPPSPPTPSPPSSSSGGGGSDAALAGGIVGGVAVAFVIGGGVYYFNVKKQLEKRAGGAATPPVEASEASQI